MRNSIKRISKHRRNSFNSDFDRQEDGLLLADIKVIPDDSRLTITPLEHPVNDQDNIDRLLVNSGFENRPSNPTQENEAFSVVGVQEDPIGSQHYDYVENLPAADINEPLIPANATNNGPNQPVTIISEEVTNPVVLEPNFTSLADKFDKLENLAITPDPVIETIGDEYTPSGHNAIARESKSAAKAKPTQAVSSATYLLLGISSATLVAACLLGFMVYQIKAELNQVKEQLTVLKEGMENKEPVE